MQFLMKWNKMNIKNFLLIIFLLNTYGVTILSSESTKKASLLEQIINFPPEVSLSQDPLINTNGLISLDYQRILTLEQKYRLNFKLRSYLKYVSRASIGAAVLYQLGFLDSFFAKNYALDADSSYFANQIMLLREEVGRLQQSLLAIPPIQGPVIQQPQNLYQKQTALQWIFGNLKSITSWVTFSILLAKVAQLSSYVDTTPTFNWFFSTHMIIDSLDALKYSVSKLKSSVVHDDIILNYHIQNIHPVLQLMVKNLEEFIAFMDYYFTTVVNNKELVRTRGMEAQSRYVFITSNNFFSELSQALSKKSYAQALVLIDEYKIDMYNCIRLCQFFEKDVLAQG